MNKSVITTLLLCLCAVLGAQAQINGGNWYNGWLVYSADQQADGKIVMNAMAEGEEHEFVLVPVADKKDTYRVADSPNHYVNEYSNIATVRHLRQRRLDVLCFYNEKNQLQAVMSKESEWDAEKLQSKLWLKANLLMQKDPERHFPEIAGDIVSVIFIGETVLYG